MNEFYFRDLSDEDADRLIRVKETSDALAKADKAYKKALKEAIEAGVPYTALGNAANRASRSISLMAQRKGWHQPTKRKNQWA